LTLERSRARFTQLHEAVSFFRDTSDLQRQEKEEEEEEEDNIAMYLCFFIHEDTKIFLSE
jgi:hypothetical protein